MLNVDRTGTGPPTVLVHGFTQTNRCWGSLATRLTAGRELILVDAPGHGASGHADADLWQGADLIAQAGGSAVYLGYSMGGRFVIHVALQHPTLVRALVLIGATAGLEDVDDRRARRQQDRDTADEIIRLGTRRFVDRWMNKPMFSGIPPHHSFVDERSINTPAGLASSIVHAGVGSQEPTWNRLNELNMPVLVIAGGLDTKFTQLGERLVQTIGANAQMEVIARAGHAAHLEQPDRTYEVVRRWLRQLE